MPARVQHWLSVTSGVACKPAYIFHADMLTLPVGAGAAGLFGRATSAFILVRDISCFSQVVIQALFAASLCSSLPLGRAVCHLRLELRPLRHLTWSAAHCLKLPQRGRAPSCKPCASYVSTLQVPATVLLVLAERRTAEHAYVQAFAIANYATLLSATVQQLHVRSVSQVAVC